MLFSSWFEIREKTVVHVTSCMFPFVEWIVGNTGRRLKATPFNLITFAVIGMGSLRAVFTPRLLSDPKALLVIPSLILTRQVIGAAQKCFCTIGLNASSCVTAIGELLAILCFPATRYKARETGEDRR